MKAKRERIFELLDEVLEAIQKNGPTGFDQEFLAATHHLHTLGLYQRTRTLFRASLAVLKENLPEEALILGRSLFTDSLRLRAPAFQ